MIGQCNNRSTVGKQYDNGINDYNAWLWRSSRKFIISVIVDILTLFFVSKVLLDRPYDLHTQPSWKFCMGYIQYQLMNTSRFEISHGSSVQYDNKSLFYLMYITSQYRWWKRNMLLCQFLKEEVRIRKWNFDFLLFSIF